MTSIQSHSATPAIAAEFSLDDDVIYLNHAAVAVWPRRTVEAVRRFAEENGRQGARGYPQWLEMERVLRGRLARLINAPSIDDIALLKSTSEALSIVAYGLDWRSGDNIVTYAQEFPSNRVVWESLAVHEVEVRLVDLYAAEDPEGELVARCDSRTRLIAVSSVQYARGMRMDLDRLGAFCRANGILLCVDAIQSLGALPFDVQACQADFVAADGHKWMLGPEGIALFYCRAELRDQLRLSQFGWHMLEHPGDYERTGWEPATSARRFECGSPNMLGIHALDASLSLLQEVGLEAASRNILGNTSFLIDFIESSPALELLSPREPSRRSGIVTFRGTAGVDHTGLFQALGQAGVVCASRGGGIRFSPHFYTPRRDLERACAVLSQPE